MNIDSSLQFAFKFIYKTEFSNGLIEHELDHVFIGHSDATPHLNTYEAVAFRWVNVEDLKKDIEKHPENYTVWFKIIIDEHFNQIKTYLEIVERFDHRNLNLDCPEFETLIPTAENIISVCWNLLRSSIDDRFDLRLKLWETENNIFEYDGK